MRSDQGYNISKIQAGASYFDNTFAGHIKNIKNRPFYRKKKIPYHLRRSTPQIVKLWRRKSQNTVNIEKVDF